jgi:hypothetical protein
MTSKPALAIASALLALAAPAFAQPAVPKPPAEYDVVLRYRIDAFRTEHIVQFDQMVQYLNSIGFQKTSEFEDERESRAIDKMQGVIASASARQLLTERHVKTILLIPRGAKIFADPEKPNPDQPLRVQLELGTLLDPTRQPVLADQVREVLGKLGFREAVGYDNRGHTRLVGMLPAGAVFNALLSDLHKDAVGATLPAPFRAVTPVRVVEVMAGMPPVAEHPPLPAVPKGTEKLAPDLRALLADKEAAAKPTRMEVILSFTPAAAERDWIKPLRQAAPSLAIDGRLGQLVSVHGLPEQMPAVAALPFVSTVRLPASARPQAQDAPAPANLREALRAAGLERLHGLGHRGKGVRVAVIDGDFRGWQGLVGKDLPDGTTLVDLTRARNRDLQPDPAPGDPQALGHGTRCAQLLMQAAPEAALTLIRIAPAAPYQLQEAARFINGENVRSLSLANRADELEDDHLTLETERKPLLEERRFILNAIEDPDVFKKRWAEYKKKQDDFDRRERDYHDRLARYLQLQRDLRGLKGVAVVACPLVWNEGHPVDGGSTLSRFFDDRPFKAAVWFQSAGNTRGQAWTGLFRDADGNGVMEFAAPGTRLPAGRWTPELNFLAWQPHDGRTGPDIPAKARLRVSLQWREAHDPEFLNRGEDPFRTPLADLRLVVLRQRDPSGTKLPADDLEVVAQSVGLPQRLDNQPAAATYEQSVEFTAEAGGRYVLRVEGRAPASIRPASAPTLPAAQRTSELRPRVFVETLSGGGRAILADFTTDRPGRDLDGGSLGMPADAHRVITVGAADRTSKPEPYSAAGPPMNLELLPKPNVLAFDVPAEEGGPYGTSLATSFSAGLAASALSAGAPACKLLEALQVPPGGLLRVPDNWPARGR